MTTEAGTEATSVLNGVPDFSADPDRAVLARGDVAATVGGVRIRGSGVARLELIPRPRIVLDCQFDETAHAGAYLRIATDSQAASQIEFDGHPMSVVVAGRKWGSAGLRAKWCPASLPVQILGDDETEMRSVRGCLFNLDFVQDTHVAHDRWSVTIQTHDDTDANRKAIREQGAYRPTHVVGVSRVDGDSFCGNEAREMLDALRNFLSFANGGPCTLVCPTGFDENGDEVWSQWSSPYDSDRVAFCWSGRQMADPLVRLFPGFMDRWADEGWRDALGTAIWWYITANGGSMIDSGIVSAQVAMERLAYEFCVREAALVSERGFDRLSAADRHRMLLGSLKIPREIHPSLGALLSASGAGGRDWKDAPGALAAIRNQLVHSGKPRDLLAPECYIEAWQLAAWLLEVVILAVCDFRGECWNRVSKRKEGVPWATK